MTQQIKSSRAFRTTETMGQPRQARLMGFRGAIASHHYQSALAGQEVLRAGGNAVDAGIAAVLVEGVVNPHMHGPAGECPILIAAPGLAPVAINGNTRAPAGATVAAFHKLGYSDMPDSGIHAAGVPASLSALLSASARFGVMPFHALLEPAIELARHGFAMHAGLREQEKVGVAALAERFGRQRWTASAEIYLRNAAAAPVGSRICNPALASVYEQLAARSRLSAKRVSGIDAVRKEFYQTSVADAIDRYSRANDGLLRALDMADFTTPIEKPFGLTLAESKIFKCGFWCQGPALLQTLQILKLRNIGAYAHNSIDYLHLLVEATKLAYADRQQFYADPLMVDVPAAGLLSESYAKNRADLINMEQASALLQPGDPYSCKAQLDRQQWLGGASWGAGTVHVDVVDKDGTMASFTPSGGWLGSHEVIEELGFPLGNRAMTFYLQENHPNVVAPNKRPRTTISPSMVTRDNTPWIAFGTMGGDQQDQWMLQFYLNVALFGMSLRQAIEAPKFSSEHFNGFFSPHDRFPNRVRIESAIGADTIAGLTARGHQTDVAPMWTEGYLNAVSRDLDSGVLEAACDPRGAIGDVFPATALVF